MKNNKHLHYIYIRRAILILLAVGLIALAVFAYFVLYPYLNTTENEGGSYFSLLVVAFALCCYGMLAYAITRALKSTFIWNGVPELQTEALVLRKLTQRQQKKVTKMEIAQQMAGAATSISLWKTLPKPKSANEISSGHGGIMFKIADDKSVVLLVPFSVFDNVSENDVGMLRYKVTDGIGKFISFEMNAAAASM